MWREYVDSLTGEASSSLLRNLVNSFTGEFINSLYRMPVNPLYRRSTFRDPTSVGTTASDRTTGFSQHINH